jgi:MoxR-like ATPase
VKALAIPALAHRVLLKHGLGQDGGTTETVIRAIVQDVPVPR